MSLLIRILVSIAGGAISSLAFPRENIPLLIFVSVALCTLAIKDTTVAKSLLIGFCGGLTFYLTQIDWMSLYLGPIPLVALSTLVGAIFALGIVAIGLVWRWLNNLIKESNKFKSLIIATAIAILWTAREWVAISMPYGGFPWSRLAQTQSETFLANWVFLGGLGILTFVIALASVLVLLWVLNFRANRVLPNLSSIAVFAMIFAIPAMVNPPADPESGSITIGAVQGNAKAGLFAREAPGAILDNHLEATKLLAANAKAGELDLVVWPENASDLNPLSSAIANRKITSLVNDQIKVPLLFGTITERDQNIYNSSILWQPNIGPTDYYDKKRPVPFAEYVPDRDFWYPLAPDLVGLVSRGYSFGTRDGIFQVGNSNLGALICFEIAIDDIGRELVGDGAQIIISQTNNADFGRSDQTYQQAAFARLRAIETGRVVVNVSTVGVSAIYSPNGKVIEEVPAFEPAVMLQTLPLRNSLTPAMTTGPAIDLLVNCLAVILLLAALAARLGIGRRYRCYRSAWPRARRARIYFNRS